MTIYLNSYWIAAEVILYAEIQEASSLEYPSTTRSSIIIVRISLHAIIFLLAIAHVRIHSTITLCLLVDITLSTKKQLEGSSSPAV